jgi:hypothetical protein
MNLYKLIAISFCILILSACSQIPFSQTLTESSELATADTNTTSTASSTNTESSSDLIQFTTVGAQYHMALLTGEQMFKSFIQLTNINGANLSAVTTEFNARKGMQSIDNDLNYVTSPLLLATTNLAGEVCNTLITKEQPLATAQRKFFKDINFSSVVNSIADNSWTSTFQVFSKTFWGRDASPEEIALYQDTLKLFRASLAANENTTNTAKNLAQITCVSTLASIEVISF